MVKKIVLGIIIFLIVAYTASFIFIKSSYRDIDILLDNDSRFVEVCGINAHYKVFGNSKEKILLIHGFGASLNSHNDIFAPLSRRFTVIAVDLPGFGLTERVSDCSCNFDPYSRNGQVEFIKEFISKLNLGSIYISGHSMGGEVAAIFTVRYPEMVKGLILEDAAIYVGGGFPPFVRLILRNPVGRALFTILTYPMLLSLRGVIKKAFYDDTKVTQEKTKLYEKALKVRNWDYGLYRIVVADNSVDYLNKLNSIEVPVLVITGKNDAIVKPEIAEKISSTIKNSSLVEIEECGHIPHEEAPNIFVDAVIRFIFKSPEEGHVFE